MFQITVYVPATHCDSVKEAMFEKGAGKIGNYSHCAWQVLGEGQFLPEEQANAYIGEKNHLEKVPEYKIELVCQKDLLKDVIQAMKDAHPYEEPAYFIISSQESF